MLLCCYFSAYLCSVFFCFCLDVFQCVKLIFCSSCLGIEDIWTCLTQRFRKITLKYLRALCENCLKPRENSTITGIQSYRQICCKIPYKHMKPFCDTWLTSGLIISAKEYSFSITWRLRNKVKHRWWLSEHRWMDHRLLKLSHSLSDNIQKGTNITTATNQFLEPALLSFYNLLQCSSSATLLTPELPFS